MEALGTPSGSALADKSSLEPKNSTQQAPSQEAGSFLSLPPCLPPASLCPVCFKAQRNREEGQQNFLHLLLAVRAAGTDEKSRHVATLPVLVRRNSVENTHQPLVSCGKC